MRFTQTSIAGAWLIEPEPQTDERGWFARIFDADEFAAHGLDPAVVQCSISYNAKRHTLRGMHYQAAPHGESKLVRCIRGAIFDVGLDLRSESSGRCNWYGVELSAENGLALYLPPGVAHGFQTLVDGSEVLYQMSIGYAPQAARGVRWDDPAFGIIWPPVDGERVISERDRAFRDFAS